ncbi:MAG: tripartite tricarboxylate transporter substrate binding protein, partial [Gammaproteobacteria bacterium]|nr:tripartite tricarboxylate transporter substrate binding protein [Gammaproteobacteria bacterium]
MKHHKLPASAAAVMLGALMSASAAHAACATDDLPGAVNRPAGFPARALTMVVPYGPAGGSGQVAQAMAQAVT